MKTTNTDTGRHRAILSIDKETWEQMKKTAKKKEYSVSLMVKLLFEKYGSKI